MLDPLLTLAVIGLGICSVVTLSLGHRRHDPRRSALLLRAPGHLPVHRRAGDARAGAHRLRAPAPLQSLALRRADPQHPRGARRRAQRAKGATRAISFPLFSFQASELGKVLLILALAAFVVDRSRRLGERDTIVRVMLAALIPAMLVIVQPDLGSGLVYITIAFVLLFVAGVPWRHLASLVALGAVAITVVLVARARRRRAGDQQLPARTPHRLPAPLGERRRTPTSSSSRRSRSARARRPAAAPARPRRRTTSCPRTKPTSSSPPSASSTASSAPRSCSRSTRC